MSCLHYGRHDIYTFFWNVGVDRWFVRDDKFKKKMNCRSIDLLLLNVILSAVKESILQQTGCLHYGRHDIFAFYQNVGQQLYYFQK